MKKKVSIQLKAAFLLIVFAINIVIGFACAVGLDMGFKTKHHHEIEEAIETNVPVNTAVKKQVHIHEEDKVQQHSDNGTEKDDCCSDSIIKFQNLDKNVNSNASDTYNLPVFVAIIPSFYYTAILINKKVPTQKHLLGFFHPPPIELRLLQQRFQI